MIPNAIDLTGALARVVQLSEEMAKPISALQQHSFEELMLKQLSLQTQMLQVTMSVMLSVALDMRRVAEGQVQ